MNNMTGKTVLIIVLVFFCTLEETYSAIIQNGSKPIEGEVSPKLNVITISPPSVSKENTTKEKAEDIYGKLTGIANKLKKESCKCVSLFDECGVEMLEETVIKVRGKACLNNQRYCCGKEEVKMEVEEESNLKKLMQSSKIEEYDDKYYKEYEGSNQDNNEDQLFSANSILRDEISIISNKNLTKQKEIDDENSFIRPSTLGAILRLLTEGFKFMTNFF